MTSSTYYVGLDKVLLAKIREALPRNPVVEVKAVTYPGVGDKKVEVRQLKLKGVASGTTGLIFTFDDGTRHSVVKFVNHEGASVTLTTK
jgi:hypothetical protein